jgi:hypothetical protein
MNALERRLIDKLSNYRDAAPVYRIEPRPLDELENAAAELARKVAGGREQERARTARGRSRSDIALADGYRARVYHASGAMAVQADLAPMEHLIGEKADKGTLIERASTTAKRFGLDRLGTPVEKLAFERLWQIKAAGMNRERLRGRDVVCRAIGAFRRYVDGLPVYGRASVVLELAGDERIGGAGVDWRPIVPHAVDRAKVLDPERAARHVAADLEGRLPGGEFGDDDFDVSLFSLGYFSLPKRRAQGTLAPVYVALLERRGWTSMNHVVVVNGTEKVYEGVTRIATLPPRDVARGARAAA